MKQDILRVRNHEDQCTKNKRMICIPMRGLFLACTENSFLFCSHIHKFRWVRISLEGRSLVHGGKFPLLTGPLLEANCPCAPCISLTPAPAPTNRAFIFYSQMILTSLMLLLGTLSRPDSEDSNLEPYTIKTKIHGCVNPQRQGNICTPPLGWPQA
jgi:hypothetical protein